jgi:HK97 family phage prohead protease
MRIFEVKEAADYTTKANAVLLDIKAIGEDGEFAGYASTFGNVDRGGDRVLAGAFRKTLAKSAGAIKMLRDHDHQKIIGEWLEAKEDAKGLWVRGRIFKELPLGEETLFLMRKGQLNSLSIGYRTLEAEYHREDDARDLKELDLWEVSVVIFPMNEAATIDQVKNDLQAKDIERILRDASVPRAFAKMIVSHGYQAAKAKLADDCREGDGSVKATAAAIVGLANILKG